ncbi:MAG: multiheme c-type cytochrome [bacterium]
MHPAKRKLALGLLVLVPFLGLTGCEDDEATGPTNTAPVINAITAATTSTTMTATVEVAADVTDEDGDTLRYRWSATKGTISQTSAAGDSIEWTAPDEQGIVTLTLEVDDGVNITTGTVDIGVDVYVPSVQPYFVGDSSCEGCHAAAHTGWASTAHAAASKDPEYCSACHNTGWDETVDNGGYDEVQLASLQGVQCESCHGPGSAHVSTRDAADIEMTLDAASCQSCHESPHNTLFTDWAATAHAGGGSVVGYPGGGRAGCSLCHSGTGYVDYIETGSDAAYADPEPINCTACHDPHSAENRQQLRTGQNVTLPGGEVVDFSKAGLGLLCLNCHTGRRGPAGIEDQLVNGSAHFGPHHGNQGGIFYADVVVRDVAPAGFVWSETRHREIEDGCVTCHMGGETGGMTGHSFEVATEACEPCHGTIETFDDIIAKNDYDGDGNVSGVQTEVHHLVDDLVAAIVATGIDTSGISGDSDVDVIVSAVGADDTTTAIWGGLDPAYSPYEVRQSAWNLAAVSFDHSYGVHNAALVIQLLQQSIKYMGGTLPGKELVEGGF